MQEELAVGDPSDEPRRRTWLWVLVGVVVLVVGSVATGLIGDSTPSASAPAPSATASPRAFVTTRPGPLSYLDVGFVCPPRTDGRRTLTVSFQLANVGGVGARVLAMTPDLPLGGLRPAGPVRSGGTCDAPGRESVRQTIALAETRFYTMTFRLPAKCPKPYPVQANYRIDVNGQQMTATLPLLDDLGALTFSTCPGSSS